MKSALPAMKFYVADEAFFTGTAAEVLPIREHDGRVIGSGRRGPVTEKLQKMYFDQVTGKSELFPEWLDYTARLCLTRPAVKTLATITEFFNYKSGVVQCYTTFFYAAFILAL